MRGLILFLALLAGCQWDTHPVRFQDEAVAIVWKQYGETHSPPGIDWVRSRRSDFAWCDDYTIWTGSTCASGFYDLRYAHVVIDSKPGDWGTPLWAFAHELYHAHLFLTTGDADPLHRDPGFALNGAVYQAMLALVRAGIKLNLEQTDRPLPSLHGPRPTCAVSMEAPKMMEGSNFFGTGDLQDCSESDWDGVMQVRMFNDGLMVGVDVSRQLGAPGNTLTIGQNARVFTNDYAPCEGVVVWTSDEPDWALSVNAVCHGADGDYDVVATFHGHVYIGND